MELTKMKLWEIAIIIQRDWNKIYFGARPYLEAMKALDSIKDNYGLDSGSSVIAYFLSNAATWHGETARSVKKYLNQLLKGK